jgi:hypothetical protein
MDPNVLDFLYHLNDALVFSLMILFTISFSLFFIFINWKFKLYKLKYRDNTATASIASMIGIIYALLTGVLCLYLLDNRDHASSAALSEGTAAANIYRESKWLKDPAQKKIQSELKNYVVSVIRDEWPIMSEGTVIDVNHSAAALIDAMSETLKHYPIVNLADAQLVNMLVLEIRDLFKARQERIGMNGSQLSQEIWYVILLSTAMVIFINYAFRLEFKLHIFSLISIAIMAASVLFLLVTLDRPFQGEFIVEPDALQAVLEIMNHDTYIKTQTGN